MTPYQPLFLSLPLSLRHTHTLTFKCAHSSYTYTFTLTLSLSLSLTRAHTLTLTYTHKLPLYLTRTHTHSWFFQHCFLTTSAVRLPLCISITGHFHLLSQLGNIRSYPCLGSPKSWDIFTHAAKFVLSIIRPSFLSFLLFKVVKCTHSHPN